MNELREQAERYLILIEGGPPSNYSAWSPDVPGCVATGDTLDECVGEMRSALIFHLEGMVEDGGEPPPPSKGVQGAYLKIAA